MSHTKRTGWHHLKQKDRDRMEALLDEGFLQCEIAKIPKVHPGTISREKKRKRESGRYDADMAELKAANARRRSKRKGMKVEDCPGLREYVIKNLEAKRSPDEISGRMRRDKESFFASKNAIYAWIYSAYGQQYCRYLCTRRWRRRKQKRKTAPGGRTQDQVRSLRGRYRRGSEKGHDDGSAGLGRREKDKTHPGNKTALALSERDDEGGG